MMELSSLPKTRSRTGQFCAAGAGLLALLSLADGIWGSGTMFGLTGGYKPMAFNTAGIILLFSAFLSLYFHDPLKPSVQRVIIFAAIILMIGPLLFWIGTLSVRTNRLFHSFLPSGLRDYFLDMMSPFTPPALILSALSFLFLLLPSRLGLRNREIASWTALTVFIVCLVILLGHMIGLPLVFGSQMAPMALFTALALVLLSISLIMAAGLEVGIFVLFRPSPFSLTDANTGRLIKSPLIGFLILLLFIGVTGSFYIKNQGLEARRGMENQLQTITTLKANLLATWYQERQADADIIMQTPILYRKFESALAGLTSESTRKDLLAWLDNLHKAYGYSQVALLDAQGQARLWVPSSSPIPSFKNDPDFQRALTSQKIITKDLHRSQSALAGMAQRYPVALNLYIPLGAGSTPSVSAKGIMLLTIDPSRFLYPLIDSWPYMSRTGETLLIRREGKEVVFLNELRHRRNTLLSSGLPLDKYPQSPAAQVIAGKEGIVEGKDYRGVPVLAAVQAVPGTPWKIISKVDQEEIYAFLRQRIYILGVIIGFSILGAALGVNLLLRYRENQWLHNQLLSDQNKRELADRILYLYKQANDIILLFNEDWKILEANDRALQTYGYTLEEMKGRYAKDFHAPETLSEFDRQISQADAPEGVIYETRHQRKDGSTFPVEISVRAITLGKQRIFQCLIRDITTRKEDEETLRKSEERFRVLFEQAAVGVAQIEPGTGRFLRVNQCYCRITGYTREEMEKLSFPEITLPDDLQEDLSNMERLIRGEVREFTREKRYRRKDGSIVWVKLTSSPMWAPGETPTSYIAVVEDISRRKAAEEDLKNALEALNTLNRELEERVAERTSELTKEILIRREAEEKSRKNETILQAVFDGITDPLILVDREMRTILINQSGLDYYGLAASDFSGIDICENRQNPDNPTCKDCYIPSAVKNGQEKVFERKSFIRSDRVEQVAIYPLQSGEEKEGAAIIRISDITEARMLQKQVVQSQKLASLGFLISGIAHEINNPNSFISFNIPILRDYLQDLLPIVDEYAGSHPSYEIGGLPFLEFRKDLFRLLENVEHGSLRINSIVANLKEFAGHQGNKTWVETDFSKVVEKSLALCKGKIERLIKRLEVQVAEDLPRLVTDPGVIEQVIINLLINAAQSADKEESWIRLTVEEDPISHGRVFIEVRDNGCRMDEETVGKIFDPFFTTKAPGEGTGLGLSVSHTQIESLGGRIEVQSQKGVGSTFRVILGE